MQCKQRTPATVLGGVGGGTMGAISTQSERVGGRGRADYNYCHIISHRRAAAAVAAIILPDVEEGR